MKKKSRSTKRTGSAKRPANYEVGYGRPPKSTRWKPGESGNRRGRPKGAKSVKAIVNEILNQRIRVRDGEGFRTISALEAMMMRFLERAMRGDPKAAAFLMDLYDEQPVLPTFSASAAFPTERPRIDATEFMANAYRTKLKRVGPEIY